MAYYTGDGSEGLRALLKGPSHGTVDFLSFARGQAMADELNWRDQLREQDQIRLRRSVQDEDDERRARTYMASMLTNMQVAADAGVNPTDYFIQQREQMMKDPAFLSMNDETKHLIIQRLGNSVSLQLQNLTNAGDMQGVSRLADAFGLTTPVNQPMLAGATGNYAQHIQAINELYGSDIALSPDGSTVTFGGMTMPAPQAIALLNSGGNRPEALQLGMAAYNSDERVRAEIDASMARSGLDRYGNPLAGGIPRTQGATPKTVTPQPAGGYSPNLFVPPQAGQQSQPSPVQPQQSQPSPVQPQQPPQGGVSGINPLQQRQAMTALSPAAPYSYAIPDLLNQSIRTQAVLGNMLSQQPGDSAALRDILFKGSPGDATRWGLNIRHLPDYSRSQ